MLCMLGGHLLISNVKRKKLRTIELFINFKGSTVPQCVAHIFFKSLKIKLVVFQIVLLRYHTR